MTNPAPRRLQLAHLPTPLWRNAALDQLVGASVWVKRDDMTAGAAAGNKIRKLEYLLGAALEQQATAVFTCGGIQSNHARATALLAAQLGLRCILLLRTSEPDAQHASIGNLMLDRLAGAEVRFITPQQYRQREPLMSAAAAELARTGQRPYVIPEGGSNGLGALGYVEAMREVRAQLDQGLGGGPEPFDAVVHACGSGGTAAGVVLGAARYRVAPEVMAIAVCDDRATFEQIIGRVVEQAESWLGGKQDRAELRVLDQFVGPAYAVASDEQRRFIAEVGRRCGLVLDPVYSGKALFGLARLQPKPRRVLFIHTGGLPGLLAQARQFAL
jgi:D-cysteine desulfhydrase